MSHSNTTMDPDEVRNAATALKSLLSNFDEMMSELLSIEIRPGNLAAGHYLEDVVGNRKEELRQHLIDLKKVVTYIGDNLEEIASLFEDVDENNAAELARVTAQIDGLVSDMALPPPEPMPGEYSSSNSYPGYQPGYVPPTYQSHNGGYAGQSPTYESRSVPANYQYERPTYPPQYTPVNYGTPMTPAIPAVQGEPLVTRQQPLEPLYTPVRPLEPAYAPAEPLLQPMKSVALPVEPGYAPAEPLKGVPAEKPDHDA
ncbi:WXG100 family type VII secretion target [Actinoalloteichus spitiensis]|uniref:WXG100 family type VII secretion target n=1 Tax=Actinoalloteichus spitiensis TaxID=252394 RepID=UPI0012F6A28A|nr:hypothetical protein [Actinoalloteichus spitiensis]